MAMLALAITPRCASLNHIGLKLGEAHRGNQHHRPVQGDAGYMAEAAALLYNDVHLSSQPVAQYPSMTLTGNHRP